MIGHATLSEIVDVCLGLIERKRQILLVFKLECDCLDESNQLDDILSERDGSPVLLLLELAL